MANRTAQEPAASKNGSKGAASETTSSKVAPKKSSPRTTSSVKAGSKKAVSAKAAPDKAAPKKAAPKKAAPEKAAGHATAPGRTAAEIARTPLGPRQLPALVPTAARRSPASAVVVTDGGLAITAVRRPSTPMVEVRLRIPFGGRDRVHAARAELLAETILLGTATLDRQQIDAALAAVGGHLGAQVGPQRLLLSGSVLAPGLPTLLAILAEVVTGAAYRAVDVDRERDKLAEHVAIMGAQPSSIARKHLQQRRFGGHPAAWELPEVDEVEAVTAAAVRGLHRRAVLPEGSALVLVGDLRPEATARAAADALGGWAGTRPARVLATPPAIVGGPVVAHHRPGAVQSQTRLTVAGAARTDPDYAAAQLANLVFGGYFSSRLVENIREDKGFTYSAHSSFEFWPGRSAVTISYDTATDVAAQALVETRHELGRISLAAPTDAEVDSARHYAVGSLASSLATQSGYASMLTTLIGSGLDATWLTRYQRDLTRVGADDVARAAARLFAPSAVTGVIVGDLEASGDTLRRLDGIEFAAERPGQ